MIHYPVKFPNLHLSSQFCYKLLSMTGTGWIRVSFAISGHFVFLVWSEKCLEIVLLIFLGS